MEVEHTHPSFALISFSKCGGNPPLFGSDLDRHYGYIALSVKRATLLRDEHGDRYDSSIRGDVLEVHMSAAQFAELITTMNVGLGVPCTLTYLDGKRIEDPPRMPDESTAIKNTFASSLRSLYKEIEGGATSRLNQILEKPNISKADRAEIRGMLARIAGGLKDRLPFILTMFDEAITKRVGIAKTEVDAAVALMLHQVGVHALSIEQTALPAHREEDQ